MSHTLDQLLTLLLTYKYLIIFPIAILEGPGLAILCGVLIARNVLDPFLTYFLLMLGEIIGDSFYYVLGRYGGRPFIKKWGHLVKMREEKLIALEHHFHHHAPKRTLFLGKTQPWGSVILFAAGTAKMNFLKFMFINTSASLIKVACLLAFGYYFNQAYVAVDKDLQYVALFLTIIAIPLVIYFFRRRAS